jgi:hypothetical protein
MKETASQLKSDETLNATTIHKSLGRRFDTGYIESPTAKEIILRKGEAGWEMEADYESVVPLFGNMNLLLAFKNKVVIN